MKCLKNRKHAEFCIVCSDCIKQIDLPSKSPNLFDLEPDLRAFFVALRASTEENEGCWYTPQAKYRVCGRFIKADNLYYAFYKGDIGNKVLKTLCLNKECVNPSHKKSRFEKPSINKTVVSGFNRKRIDFTKIPDAQWLREV